VVIIDYFNCWRFNRNEPSLEKIGGVRKRNDSVVSQGDRKKNTSTRARKLNFTSDDDACLFNKFHVLFIS
jgi:hypothetical protein